MKIIICDKKITFDGAAIVAAGNSVTADVLFDESWDDYPARVIIGYNPRTGALASSLIRDGKVVIHTDGFKRLPRLEVFAFGVNKDGRVAVLCHGNAGQRHARKNFRRIV